MDEEEDEVERMSRCDTCKHYLKVIKACILGCSDTPGYCVDADKWEPIVEIKKEDETNE